MSLYALIRNFPNPTEDQVEEFVSGNLCRCTGYRSILEAGKSLIDPKERICPSTGKPCKCQSEDETKKGHECKEEDCDYCYPKHAIFPSELRKREHKDLIIKTNEYVWCRPTTFESFVNFKKEYPHSRIVNGFTDKYFKEDSFIHASLVPDFNIFKVEENGVLIGGSLSISSCIEKLTMIKDKKGISQVLFQLSHIASMQIRNIGSIAGSLACGHPVASLSALFASMDAEVNVFDCYKEKMKTIKVKDLYQDLYKTILIPSQVIKSIFIPFLNDDEYLQTYKQAHRNTFDWSYVISGMKATIETKEDKKIIKKASLYFGGLDKIIKNAKKTKKFLKGKELNEETFKQSLTYFIDDFPIDNIIWGKEEYKLSLAQSFYQKFFYYLKGTPIEELPDVPSKGESSYDPKNKNYHMNKYAILQTKGEAIYVDDIPHYNDELHVEAVISRIPHGEILKVDPTEALKVEGVTHFFTHKDIPGKNIINGEEFLRVDKVTSVGQFIGLIVATSRDIARKAVKLVKVEYKILDPVLTIQESIEKKTCVPYSKVYEKGNLKQEFPNTLTGTVISGGQEHFYLETNSSISIPSNEEMTIYSSTQYVNGSQLALSPLLNMSLNNLIIKIKRIGGGFGGKETASVPVAASTSLCALLTKKPVRMVLDRDTDIMVTGQRHPYLSHYSVSFDNDGNILALDTQLYSNGGHSLEVTSHVMDASLRNVDGAYNIPNVKAQGFLCKTNTPSNCAFRGFGSPQGLFIIENVMDRVANYLKKDPNEIRFKNLLHSEDVSCGGDIIKDCSLERMWKELLEKSEFEKRRKDIEKFNKENEFKKRSIYMIPTKHGVGMPDPIYQGAALIHIYNDGTVMISCGGSEMGQGLYTKLIQIAANELQIPFESVHFVENSSDKTINQPPSGGSSGSDLWGSAVLSACKELNQRLAPYREMMKDKSFPEIVQAACFSRVNLTCQGFSAPKSTYKNFYRYYTYGVGASEVEVDLLTGKFIINRTDLIMDFGNSLNPLIDIGQIEGGFIQGTGLFTLEEFVIGRDGKIQSLTERYKIPTVKDIPKDFRVHLLSDSEPKDTIFMSSKGVGEPPLFLGSTVYFALKNIIQEVSGKYKEISAPLTVDKIKTYLN